MPTKFYPTLKKKEVYDNYGEEGLKEGMGSGGEGFDPFSMFFGGGSGGQRGGEQKRKCKSNLAQMKITLEEAYKGGKKNFEYKRRITCKSCKGTGSGNPAANNKCGGCNGKGIKLVMQRMGHIVLQTQQTCSDCQGEGSVIKDKCKDCKGDKVQYVNKVLEVDLDKGIPDGYRYSFYGEGDEYPEIETGDLFIEIYIEKHKTFMRKGADLIYKTPITLLQALTGVSLVLTHLDGKKILIKSKEDEIIKPGVFKTVKDLGMPFHNSPYKNGHLYIDFEIIFPDKLDEDELKQISDILNHERLNKTGMTDENSEVYNLSDYKAEDENTHHSGGKGTHRHEEEDDEESGYGGRAQTMNCAHQ